MYHDSVGNTYTSLPTKKPTKGAKKAKPGPKHSRPHGTIKKKHGDQTGRARIHEAQTHSRDFRQDKVLADRAAAEHARALRTRRTKGPRDAVKS